MKNLKKIFVIILFAIVATIVLSSCEKSYSEKDYYYLQRLIIENEKPSKKDLSRYDLNRDGVLDSSDYVKLANIIKVGDE